MASEFKLAMHLIPTPQGMFGSSTHPGVSHRHVAKCGFFAWLRRHLDLIEDTPEIEFCSDAGINAGLNVILYPWHRFAKNLKGTDG
jgi:hypothetical protein